MTDMDGGKKMKLYDNEIQMLKEGWQDHSFRELREMASWPMQQRETLIMRSETAYELGAEGKESVSGLAFTFSDDLVAEDGVYLCGQDLSRITEDTSFARVTLLRLSQDVASGQQALYDVLQRLESIRYCFYPQGYMMRVSAVKEREPVRVSAAAVEEGISFGKIGALLRQAYKKIPCVEVVQTYFITQPDFPYRELKEQVRRFSLITSSLNHIFKNASMDCSTCASREICDAIEGLRELHFGREKIE